MVELRGETDPISGPLEAPDIHIRYNHFEVTHEAQKLCGALSKWGPSTSRFWALAESVISQLTVDELAELGISTFRDVIEFAVFEAQYYVTERPIVGESDFGRQRLYGVYPDDDEISVTEFTVGETGLINGNIRTSTVRFNQDGSLKAATTIPDYWKVEERSGVPVQLVTIREKQGPEVLSSSEDVLRDEIASLFYRIAISQEQLSSFWLTAMFVARQDWDAVREHLQARGSPLTQDRLINALVWRTYNLLAGKTVDERLEIFEMYFPFDTPSFGREAFVHQCVSSIGFPEQGIAVTMRDDRDRSAFDALSGYYTSEIHYTDQGPSFSSYTGQLR